MSDPVGSSKRSLSLCRLQDVPDGSTVRGLAREGPDNATDSVLTRFLSPDVSRNICDAGLLVSYSL